MPRRVLGPFPELMKLDGKSPTELKALVHDVLAEAGCNCSGAAVGDQRDHYWDVDLSQLVARCIPHVITLSDGETKKSSVLLETLRVEIDDNNEICAWLYSETG